MKDPRARWKATSAAVGAAALMTVPASSAQASPPAGQVVPTTGWSLLQQLTTPGTAAEQAQLLLAEERYLGLLGSAVTRLEARAAALGAPSTLTPWQAARFRATVAAASGVQSRLAALAAAGSGTLTDADLARIVALRARAAAVADEVRSALSSATIVRPAATPKVETARLADRADADGDRHFCDGDHDGVRDASFREGSWGDRSWGERSWSYGDHHRFHR